MNLMRNLERNKKYLFIIFLILGVAGIATASIYQTSYKIENVYDSAFWVYNDGTEIMNTPSDAAASTIDIVVEVYGDVDDIGGAYITIYDPGSLSSSSDDQALNTYQAVKNSGDDTFTKTGIDVSNLNTGRNYTIGVQLTDNRAGVDSPERKNLYIDHVNQDISYSWNLLDDDGNSISSGDEVGGLLHSSVSITEGKIQSVSYWLYKGNELKDSWDNVGTSEITIDTVSYSNDDDYVLILHIIGETDWNNVDHDIDIDIYNAGNEPIEGSVNIFVDKDGSWVNVDSTEEKILYGDIKIEVYDIVGIPDTMEIEFYTIEGDKYDTHPITLNSETGKWDTIYDTTQLPNGEYTVKIIATRSADTGKQDYVMSVFNFGAYGPEDGSEMTSTVWIVAGISIVAVIVAWIYKRRSASWGYSRY